MRGIIVLVACAAACFSKPAFVGDSDDASTEPPCDAVRCEASGGVCQVDACLIRTSEKGATPRCPDGMACVVECLDEGCEMGVDCAAATSCTVACSGDNACNKGGVDCGVTATCTVACRGGNACERGKGSAPSIECRLATCDVTCDGGNACLQGVAGDGACTAHCCGGACLEGTGGCARDADCS